MQIRWTAHALRRLQERPGLTAESVEAAVRLPDQFHPDASDLTRVVARKAWETETALVALRVYYRQEPGGVAVLSFLRSEQGKHIWARGS